MEERALACVALVWSVLAVMGAQDHGAKSVIAHRGASAYAPEHTRAAYKLAVKQRADFVEQDLAVTRDGILICLHDESLERTTNVEEVFPERAQADPATGRRRWMAGDFTLAEIKRLDAGSWFDQRFAGERILTWDEAVSVVGGRAGLYPELKSPSLYTARGIDMVKLVADALRRGGFDKPGARPLILQSFDPDAVRALKRELPGIPRVLLVDPQSAAQWLTPEGLKTAATFATGIGPAKALIDQRADLVAAAHRAGLTVTPYTFRSTDRGRFPDVRAEMAYFFSTLGVDALFTDNPDLAPRR
jgi:glycerophosphoryl diester phosphodiesterase